MTDSYLIIPIKLEALNLQFPQTVMSAMADFSRLPWSSGQSDYQSETPYLGNALTDKPFQNKNLTLSSGLHLHWTLPRALRTSAGGQGKVAFPAAPNRWLITRSFKGNVTHWIVESDYMSPTMSTFNMDAVTVPIMQKSVNSGRQQPYMYLGRQLPLVEWLAEQTDKKVKNIYWKAIQGSPLTAMGYGEVSFNTFYPNCRSVFGFYDHESPTDCQYEVLGWYADPNDDVLTGATSAEDIQDRLKWQVTAGHCPNRSLYYASISPEGRDQSQTPPDLQQVAVGNTGTEALSAYLAHNLSTTEKPAIENQLEAILMGSKVNSSVDAGPNFEESRHQKGFNTENSGLLWTLKKIPLPGSASTTPSSDDALPEHLASLLNDLNLAQNSYNKTQEALAVESFQLYSDWYKYMMSCYPPLGGKDDYPDPDHLKLFIEMNSIPKVVQLQRASGILHIEKNSDTISVSTPDNISKAAHVTTAFQTLNNALIEVNKALASSGHRYDINNISAARYYEPSDPVLLFAGDASAQPHLEEHDDGPLPCLFTDTLVASQSGAPFSNAGIGKLVSASDIASQFLSATYRWHPQILEWLVSFFPVYPESNIGSPDAQYQTDFINHNFSLNEDCFDFTQQKLTAKVACEYRGRTYVSSSVSAHVKKSLQDFLLGRYPKLDKDNFDASLITLWKMYPSEKQNFSNPGYSAAEAYQTLAKKFILTQSVGGFNLALLQHTNSLNIPIADPLGFSNYQKFTQQVSEVLQGAYTAAPNPDALFMPIRSGSLSFQELAICDHFGRVNQANLDNIITSNPMALTNNNQQCWLSPRLAQPARLNFRLLAANPLENHHELEMNSHPTTSPICGWMMINYLDNSVACYNSAGKNLGSFNQLGHWQETPGAEHPITDADLSSNNPANLNKHLLKLLIYIQQTTSKNSSYINDLVTALQGAQENIHPESFAGNNAISLLMGKPIAIVRSRINLEVKGGLHSDQGWTALRSSMQNGKRMTAGYETVSFPLRLGEYKQLDDGLMGYWVEDDDGYQNNVLYINDSQQAAFDPDNINKHITQPYSGISNTDILSFLMTKKGLVKRQDFALQFTQGGIIFDELIKHNALTLLTDPDANIQYYANAGLIQQTLTAEPVNLTMLMDPHGLIHASCGILPVNTIQIPPEYYTNALKHIEVNFFTAPILTPTEKLQISIPKEIGHHWYWLQKQENGWQRTPNVPVITQTDFDQAWKNYLATLPKEKTLPSGSPWNELLSKGWLQPLHPSSDLFQVVAKNIKSHHPLDIWKNFNQELTQLITAITKGITPFTQNADFYPKQTILEGWLELT